MRCLLAHREFVDYMRIVFSKVVQLFNRAPVTLTHLIYYTLQQHMEPEPSKVRTLDVNDEMDDRKKDSQLEMDEG